MKEVRNNIILQKDRNKTMQERHLEEARLSREQAQKHHEDAMWQGKIQTVLSGLSFGASIAGMAFGGPAAGAAAGASADMLGKMFALGMQAARKQC